MTYARFNNNLGQKSISSFVDELFQELPGHFTREWNSGFPPVNIHETKDAYHLELNAPGRNKEDFSLNVENGLLTIGYEKKEEPKSEDYKTVRKEFSYKSFKRTFTLDDRIDAGAVQAKYENGVLKLYLPKKEQAKESAKNIPIA